MSHAEQLSLLSAAAPLAIGTQALLLPRYAAPLAEQAPRMLAGIVQQAPLRHMVTPGGQRMSVAMTNCGQCGWISDRKGYRYTPLDPASGRPWPAMPPALRQLAQRAAAAAGFDGFEPDACLVNYYAPGTRLTLHQDRNERDFSAPVVSLSLGLSATFLFGGLRRRDPVQRIQLHHADVVVWGGQQRLAFHGIAPLHEGEHPVMGRWRVNLTFRRAL
jgi:alkylated DNA repair protein (DNA oxidative demethylase)